MDPANFSVIGGFRHYGDKYLDIYAESFQADRKPWDVGPNTRALAAFCHVLFNSNKFLYLE